MEHYKKVAKYWRDSLIDKLFSCGKYKSSDLTKTFVLNRKNAFFKVNEKNILKRLSSFEDDTVETWYIPFTYRKMTNHNRYEKDYRPEILFPIIFKVMVSENGFIYPIEKPVIPRDLLLPLDKDDFFIGSMEDYDLFIAQNDIPLFEFSEAHEWEKYYSESIESQYRDGLINCLRENSLIDGETTEDYKKQMKVLSQKKGFSEVLDKYNEKWDETIEYKLTNDLAFKKSVNSYIAKWDDFFQSIEQLLDKVVRSKEVLDCYEKVKSAYFTEGKLDVSSKITAVYEEIYTRKEDVDLPLFKNYTTIEEEHERPIVDSGIYFSKRLGHNNDKYPLADAQRTAVSALIAAKKGEILPVNGPPGTGKTTMLLSVVACLWVEKAVKGNDPPVIIANSTNNQAVTNIIDAFAKDFSKGTGDFAGRWIDGIDSFGSYFVSSMRSVESEEKGYMTEDVIKKMETEDFYLKAKRSFLEKSRKAFQDDNITVEESVQKLHELLLKEKRLLENVEEAYQNYHTSGGQIRKAFSVDYTDEDSIVNLGKTLFENKKEIAVIEDKWEQYLSTESLFLSVFSFLPFVRKKRNLKAKIYAKENDFFQYFHIDNMDAERFLSVIEDEKAIVSASIQQYDAFKKASEEYVMALNELESGIPPQSEFIDIDRKADTQIRFKMFLIATHYWEGRWLMDMENLIEKDHLNKIDWTFKNIRENNWKRRMKLTPCAVMTSYMLPNYFSCSRKIHDNLNKVDYLFNFIDLLIIDEAGQVSPEVAGAGFSLAQKALVIGDTKQIPPISKLTKSIDVGNLHKANLISKSLSVNEIDNAYETLQVKGITSAEGSVMKISQNRSQYHPEKKLERGLYLYEHRRCYDNIIAYCNELCYKGVLKPIRGTVKPNALLPSMGYLHIEGKCRDVLGSKQNDLEAKVIVGWIITHYKKLKEAYNEKPLKDIVAVVTPFREQARKIEEYLMIPRDKRLKDELSHITVGTVHSLQGAEREVVLFSPTYSRHNNGSFIDRDKSMLNVAVSRAKDSFLVFGDMSLFNGQTLSPTGILAKYLFENENNMLSYVYQYSESFVRNDLVLNEKPQILINYEAHDAFLKKAFEEAKQRMVIISPWIIYSTIASNGYNQLLSNKDIKITIYTDEKFNTYTQNKLDKRKEEEFYLTVDKLKTLGVEIHIKNNIHSKIVIKDNDVMCIGSFNWFSAQRGGTYTNTEHSIVYQGENIKDEIESILRQLS